jgi:hypothetical protein
MRGTRTLILWASLWGCGSKSPAPVQPPPAVHHDPVAAPVVPPKPNHPAEWYAPVWKKVGVGQTISFSVAAIDQDLDEVAVSVTKLPASATFDPITQTVTWTPTADDLPKGSFEVTIREGSLAPVVNPFEIEVAKKPQPEPVAEAQSAVIETLLMIRQPKRLEAVNKDWPLDKLLAVGADDFKAQFTDENRPKLTVKNDRKTGYEQFLTALAQTHANPRLDPKSPQFDANSFGDPNSWKIVAFRPRIDKAWTELRIVYRAMNAAEPVFAMFRIRPVVEYVPALPRPAEEREANNKIFLGMVAKYFLDKGAPSDKLFKNVAADAKAVAAFMNELMAFDDTKAKPYRHAFVIGIAMEARMGGGSARNADGTYKSGDGWGWSAMKPFQSNDGTRQIYQNVSIPGFWTQTVPSEDGKTWIPKCAPRFTADDPKHEPGYEVLCRKTMGFVDLPDTKDGKIVNGKREANNLFVEHKLKFASELLALEDGRRDLGEENGMTCSQCHIRNFGMHDFSDAAVTDPSAGTPKAMNHPIPTLNFQIVPDTHWEPFTLEFLAYQECRGKQLFTEFLGPDSAKGLTCPLAK